MTRRVVGILGGMGPEATILLQQRILATVRAADDGDHVPLLIDMNPQVPSRIAHLIEGTGPNPGPVLATMARRLETAGASALACNTAHHHVAEIEAAVSIPFLNMIELSLTKAAGGLSHVTSVGLLASPAVRSAGVFDVPLRNAGLTALWPEDGDRMLDAIRAIKAAGPTSEARRTLADAAGELAGKGAAILFVACSEFSLIADTLPGPVPVIDTIDVLADAIHDFTLMN